MLRYRCWMANELLVLLAPLALIQACKGEISVESDAGAQDSGSAEEPCATGGTVGTCSQSTSTGTTTGIATDVGTGTGTSTGSAVTGTSTGTGTGTSAGSAVTGTSTAVQASSTVTSVSTATCTGEPACRDASNTVVAGCNSRCGYSLGFNIECPNDQLTCIQVRLAPGATATTTGEGPFGWCVPPAALKCTAAADCVCLPPCGSPDWGTPVWTCNDGGCQATCRR